MADGRKKQAVEQTRVGLGILCVVSATIIFAFQDAITKTLVSQYPVSFIIMVRYFAFLAAGFYMIRQAPGGVRVNAKSHRVVIQCLRGLLLLVELLSLGLAFKNLGLAEATSVFQAYPLFGTILAVFILGEKVSWRRILALIIGFVGIMIMLRPGSSVASMGAFWALSGAVCFALYLALTRLVSRKDSSQTSFFYVGLVGFVIMTSGLPFFWVSMNSEHVIMIVTLCITSIAGHFLMIKSLSFAPLTVIQPFNYLQLVWSVILGYCIFGDLPDFWTFIGAFLVVGSGLFVFYREQMRAVRIKT